MYNSALQTCHKTDKLAGKPELDLFPVSEEVAMSEFSSVELRAAYVCCYIFIANFTISGKDGTKMRREEGGKKRSMDVTWQRRPDAARSTVSSF